MIYNKVQAFDVPGCHYYSVWQRYRGHNAAAIAMLSDELPRDMVAKEVRELRKRVRLIVSRTERKRLIASKR
jgi:hypothetical protein